MRSLWTLPAGLAALFLAVNLANAAAPQPGPASRSNLLAADDKKDDKKDDKAAEKEKEEAEIRAELAKLPPEDRKLAEQQKYCAIEDDNRLGEMGPPIKLMIKGQPVFICCKGCKKQAEADPDKTLAKVKDLKAKAAAEAKKDEKKDSKN
jgi:hypothetical protein